MNRKKLPEIFEIAITVVIVLVVIHTFLEDFAVIAGWNTQAMTFLMVAGFFFDLFFSLEFLIRLGMAVMHREAGEYLIHKKGWIDFLASIPLLILNSGPALLMHIFGGRLSVGFGGILNMLKLIKAIRIARVLRLLRILKVFRNIKYTDSVMAQRHVAKIITMGIVSIVVTLLLVGSVADILDLGGSRADLEKREQAVLMRVEELLDNPPGLAEYLGAINLYPGVNPVLIVKIEGESVYSRFPRSYYHRNFGYADYAYRRAGMVEIFFDLRETNRLLSLGAATNSLIFFFVVLVLVIAFLVLYSPHFALTVTDPIYVMKRGMGEPSYNLNVKIPARYAGDDIYQLSRLFNEKYLPMKDLSRSSGEEEISTELSLDDFQDLVNREEN